MVKIIGRHMDGIDPTFRCPACDGEVSHPTRAPADAGTYDSGRDEPRDHRSEGGSTPFDDGGATTVVDGVPPLDVRDVRAGDRITVHYDAPGRTARQTAAGTVEATARRIEFETDTRRDRRLDPSTGVLSDADGTLGRATRVLVTR